jgi:hypothetical protein
VRALWLALPLIACSGEREGTPDAGGGDASADATPPRPDPCEGLAPACPEAPGDLAEGGGLVPIDRCAFPLEERDEWDARGAVIDGLAAALEPVGLPGVLADLNRVAVPIAPGALPGTAPAVQQAFAWQAGDMSVAYWIPQGIDTDRVGDRRVLLVSWYYDRASEPGSEVEKGVRIAVVDATDPEDIRYRFVLLVDPLMDGDRPSFRPVEIHAGGLAWVGRYLYVVHTGVGFRVFDLDRILRVTGSEHEAHGYAYVLPQVDTVAHASACAPRFSFVALDRSTTPPSLLSGEYDAGSIEGRLYRWPLDPRTGRLQVVGAGRVIADEAWFSGHSHLQGALAHEGQVWLSSSKPAGSAGILYRAAEGTPSASFGWSDTPEDLSLDPVDPLLWSLSEGLDARYVFAIDHTAVD